MLTYRHNAMEGNMNNIKNIIETHGIRTRRDGGRLLAEDVSCKGGDVTRRWVDVTSFSKGELARWLGY